MGRKMDQKKSLAKRSRFSVHASYFSMVFSENSRYSRGRPQFFATAKARREPMQMPT